MHRACAATTGAIVYKQGTLMFVWQKMSSARRHAENFRRKSTHLSPPTHRYNVVQRYQVPPDGRSHRYVSLRRQKNAPHLRDDFSTFSRPRRCFADLRRPSARAGLGNCLNKQAAGAASAIAANSADLNNVRAQRIRLTAVYSPPICRRFAAAPRRVRPRVCVRACVRGGRLLYTVWCSVRRRRRRPHAPPRTHSALRPLPRRAGC